MAGHRLKYVGFIFSLLILFQPHAHAATPLNSAVLIFHEWDYARCTSQIKKAAAMGNKKIQISFSIGFEADSAHQMKGYCMQRFSGACEPIDEKIVSVLEEYFTQCFQGAVAENLDIAILPHLDDRTGNFWRNLLDFEPLEKYQGFSYEEVMIDPILRALEKTTLPKTKVEFSIQGEMGASVFLHPESYSYLLKKIKSNGHQGILKTGLSFNWNGIDGYVSKNHVLNKPAIQRLFEEIDFVGMSEYHGVSFPVMPQDFQETINAFMEDLKTLGLYVPITKAIHFVETGLGGGASHGGTAITPQEAASAPYMGVGDPKVWENSEIKKFRKEFHQALMSFLATNQKPWRVDAAYLWNSISYDVQGLSCDTFADQDISNLIYNYNTGIALDDHRFLQEIAPSAIHF